MPWNSSVFTYSNAPTHNLAADTVENGAPYAGNSQSGKWVDVNLSSSVVSGFEFQAKRRNSSSGSIIMSEWGGERGAIRIGGNFAPLVITTGPDGTATLPDYAAMADVSGIAGVVTVSQVAAPGSSIAAGKIEVVVSARDAEGNTVRTGFNVAVRDGTPPALSTPSGSSRSHVGFAPTMLTSPEPLPDFSAYLIATDNVIWMESRTVWGDTPALRVEV